MKNFPRTLLFPILNSSSGFRVLCVRNSCPSLAACEAKSRGESIRGLPLAGSGAEGFIEDFWCFL